MIINKRQLWCVDRNSFANINRLLQEKNKTTGLTACPHCQTPGIVRLLDHDCNELDQEKNKTTRLAVCPHCQTPGSVRLLDHDCIELDQEKNKTTRLAVCPHCQPPGSIRLLDRDHNAASNILQLVEFYAGLGISIFRARKSAALNWVPTYAVVSHCQSLVFKIN
jgi:hypothetical protein